MNNLTFRSFYFYPLTFIFFFIDIILNGYFEKQIIQILLCFLILSSIKKPAISATCSALIMLSLESCLFYGKFGFDLAIIIPFIFIARNLNKLFTMPYLIANFLILTYLFLRIFILEKLILGFNLSLNYTFLLIFVNIIVSVILKLLIQGGPGNRLHFNKI